MKSSFKSSINWNERMISVVSARGLAKMKRIAGRDQDLLDLKKLGFADHEEVEADDSKE